MSIIVLIFRGAVSIFLTSYILSFKSYNFLKNELNNLAYTSRYRNIHGHSSCYITEGRAKMLIRRFRNNDTGAFRKYWRGTEFQVINSKTIGQVCVKSAKFF